MKKEDSSTRRPKAIKKEIIIPLRKPKAQGKRDPIGPDKLQPSQTSFLDRSPESLTLTITASPEDWLTLYEMATFDPCHLGKLLSIQAREVFEKHLQGLISTLPRGVHDLRSDSGEDDRGLFFHEVRLYAAAVHTYVAHWLKKPANERPDEFHSLMNSLTQKGYQEKNHSIYWIVQKIVEYRYSEKLSSYGFLVDLTKESFQKVYFKEKDKRAAAKYLFSIHNHTITIDELFEFMR